MGTRYTLFGMALAIYLAPVVADAAPWYARGEFNNWGTDNQMSETAPGSNVFKTTVNDTVLHTDASVLPASPRARASWNFRLDAAAAQPPSVTYDLNRLQGICGDTQYCVTLNSRLPIDAGKILRRFEYRHPQFDRAATAAQSRWSSVSGVNHTHYCGAYWRYGFHEDGLMSAQRVAADLGISW